MFSFLVCARWDFTRNLLETNLRLMFFVIILVLLVVLASLNLANINFVDILLTHIQYLYETKDLFYHITQYFKKK
jgi:hypothetical protein